MRTVIERVTCDRCGQVFDFEKLTNDGIMRARIEPLGNWLMEHGWSIETALTGNLKPVDICPRCSEAQ